MSSLRVFTSSLSIVAIAAGSLALSVSAAAARTTTGFIDVQNSQVVSPQTNVGLVSVVIADSTPLTAMTVSLFQNGTDVLDLPMSDFTTPANDGNGQFLTWTLKTPITTSQLPLGVYDAEVSATDSTSDSVTDQEAGALFFQNEVLFTGFKSNGTRFSFDQPNATFSGQASLLAPGGTPVPFANSPVQLTGTYSSINAPVTTDSSGAFTVTVKAQSADYWMEYAGNPQTETAFSATLPIAITLIQLPMRIHATLARTQVNAGAKDSVNGYVTYIDKGVTKQLTKQSISLYQGFFYFGEPPTATTTTGSGGKFSMPVPTTQTGAWSVEIPSSPYFSGGQVNLQLNVAEPNRITSFRAKLDSFAVVSYSGCVSAQTGYVVLQYAAKRTGPWHTIGKTPAFTGTSCTQGRGLGNEFSGQAFARLAGAYYRTRYFATPTWQTAVSTSTFLHKFLTKITSFGVTPRSVGHNGTITVSGRLWANTKPGKWRPYPHRRVIVVFRFQGTWYRYPHAPETNASGRFSGSFTVYASSPFFAQYNGDSRHFASASKRIKVSAAAVASTATLSLHGVIPLASATILYDVVQR